MKRKHVIILISCLCLFGVWYMYSSQTAVTGDFRIHEVSQGSQSITEQLDEDSMEALSSLLSEARCRRWKNPIGAIPLLDDTICVRGMDDNGLHTIILVGSTGRCVSNDRMIVNGSHLLERALKILDE